ncbi:MAG: hypothetical protein M0Z67_16860 [Nitrospiraceae bacterium]|nr:hypothetical protein [Nitrospiraceae bacterium]
MNAKENRIDVYLDDNAEPVASYSPPGSFELDTTTLDDGPHRLRIVALDRYAHRGVREIPFEVRNGPGIAVDGLHEGDIVEGKIGILINAYGGAYEEKWEPTRAETPKPVPTWAWVAFIVVVAWAMYYAVHRNSRRPPHTGRSRRRRRARKKVRRWAPISTGRAARAVIRIMARGCRMYFRLLRATPW